MKEQVKCGKCGEAYDAEYAVEHEGRMVCEDCAMNLMSPAKACDPWAVKMASGSFETKADAVATLQGTEKQFYDYIAEKGRAPSEKLPELLGITRAQLERSMSVLRHMELLRGDRRADGGADIVLFDS